MIHDEDTASDTALKTFSSVMDLCVECRRVCAWNNHTMSAWEGRYIKESTCIKCSASVKVNIGKLSMYGAALHSVCKGEARVKKENRGRRKRRMMYR